MKRKAGFLLLILAFLAANNSIAKNAFSRRILRVAGNVAKKSHQTHLVELMTRASNAGYNGIFIDDGTVPIISRAGATWIAAVKAMKAEADKLNLAYMPMSLGQRDPSRNNIVHAEAYPVKGTEFVVSGGIATVKPDPTLKLNNGGFEEIKGGVPVGWKTSASPMFLKIETSQTRPGSNGKTCLRIENPTVKDMKFIQTMNLKPFRGYELSVWVKTQNFTQPRDIGFEVNAGSYFLLANRYQRGVPKNQNWKKYSVDFCTQHITNVRIILCATSMFTSEGTVWFDDAEIREVGLLNTVNRATLAPVVKSADGTTTYKAGKDYVAQSEKLSIPAGSAIQNGATLLVDWFQEADAMTTPGAGSFCHSGVWDLTRQNVKAAHQAFVSPPGWFLKYSEWRTAYWDPTCEKQYASAGEYMGGTAKKTVEILRELNPKMETYIWNDNFDPYHNAGESYQMVNGSTLGSWNALDPKTIIINWNVHGRLASLKFFAGKDPKYLIKTPLRQIVSSHMGRTNWLTLIGQAEKTPGFPDNAIVGIQYCTWGESNYDHIEALSQACKKEDRWLSGPIPFDYKAVEVRNGKPAVVPAFNATDMRMNGKSLRISYSAQTGISMETAIRDIRGRTLISRTGVANQPVILDVSGLAKGVYFVTVKSKASRTTSKFTIM